LLSPGGQFAGVIQEKSSQEMREFLQLRAGGLDPENCVPLSRAYECKDFLRTLAQAGHGKAGVEPEFAQQFQLESKHRQGSGRMLRQKLKHFHEQLEEARERRSALGGLFEQMDEISDLLEVRQVKSEWKMAVDQAHFPEGVKVAPAAAVKRNVSQEKEVEFPGKLRLCPARSFRDGAEAAEIAGQPMGDQAGFRQRPDAEYQANGSFVHFVRTVFMELSALPGLKLPLQVLKREAPRQGAQQPVLLPFHMFAI
jgi:hypothetical protein